VIHHEYTSLALLNPASGLLKIYALNFPGHPDLLKKEITIPRELSPSGEAIATGKPVCVRGAELERYQSEIIKILRNDGMQTVCCVPLTTRGRTFGSLNVASRRLDAFPERAIELLQQVAAQIAIAVENAMAFKEIDALKDKLAEEKLYLEEEIRSEFNFEEIIGDAPSLKRALAQVELVAPADTAVLILGETGTGKELIARFII
jgi:formate hydrogenlyase transcriptional activator